MLRYETEMRAIPDKYEKQKNKIVSFFLWEGKQTKSQDRCDVYKTKKVDRNYKP